jgi:hypothetical protein
MPAAALVRALPDAVTTGVRGVMGDQLKRKTFSRSSNILALEPLGATNAIAHMATRSLKLNDATMIFGLVMFLCRRIACE